SPRPPMWRSLPSDAGSSLCATGWTARTGSRPPTPARRQPFGSAPAARGRCCPAAAWRSQASTRRTGGWWPRARDSGSTASSSRLCRQLRPDLLGEHEADVLPDHVQLLDLLSPARAEEVDEPLHELLRGARAGGDAERANALEPLLVDLKLVVDQLRAGAEVAGDLDEAVRVRRVARADHEDEIARARHDAHR